MIPPPHGGRLIHRVLEATETDRRRAEQSDLRIIRPFIDAAYDAVQICTGAYSPLEGFMGSADYQSVISKSRLANGLPFPIPILLAPSIPSDVATMRSVRPGEEVGLSDQNGRLFAMMKVEERFPIDREQLAERVYGTQDRAHPNVADIFELGDDAYSGPLKLLSDGYVPPPGELTPSQSREEFGRRGWKNVAAYQCRNPPHTAHEYLQRLTLEREDIDGIFVNPVVGRLKKGDYRPAIILKAYEELLRAYYPKERAVLSGLPVTMRYAGPKAALFFAVVRKNFGCSHYIVGRDQAGVGKYYDPYACHRIFDEFDVGIVPLRYEETFFCSKCGWMATPKTCPHPLEARVSTSQTRIRLALEKGEPLPMEIIRPEVAAVLQGSENVLN